jgi:hypothetical protein
MDAKLPFNPVLPYTGSVDENDVVTLTDANGATHAEKVPGAYSAARSGKAAGMSIGYDVRGDVSCVSIPIDRSLGVVIPILRNHDHASPPIGLLTISGNGLTGEMLIDATREDLLSVFGGAGIHVLEQDVRFDDNTGSAQIFIRKFEVLEFSLCGQPYAPVTNDRLGSLIDVIDTRLKNTSPAHVMLAPDDWRLLKPLLMAGLATQGHRVTQFADLARWLEGMHDYARPTDQSKLAEAAAIVRAAGTLT